jgi:hypothetical protein
METGNAGRSPYEIGFDDHAAGKTLDQNPFWNGELTKLGSRKFSEEAIEWENGFRSRMVRAVSAKEVADAAKVDVSRFRRKSNRHYR